LERPVAVEAAVKLEPGVDEVGRTAPVSVVLAIGVGFAGETAVEEEAVVQEWVWVAAAMAVEELVAPILIPGAVTL